MKIGIVSDIHCNISALRIALDRMGTVDRLLCLGDAISQHRFSNEVVRLLLDRGAACIRGNHEAIFLGVGGARARAAADIDPSLLEWMRAWPDERHVDIGGRRLWMVHGTPWQADGYVPPDDPRFAGVLATSDADMLLCGHTHRPAVRHLGGKLLVNPGSVGEGRPTEAGFVRSFALIDTVAPEATILDLP